MGIEKRFKNPTIWNYLNGAMQITAAVGTIYFGISEYDRMHSGKSPLSADPSEIPAENYLNEYRATHRNNKRNTYSYHRTPSAEGLKFQAQTFDVIEKTSPYLLFSAGLALGISGIGFLTNRKYKKRYF